MSDALRESGLNPDGSSDIAPGSITTSGTAVLPETTAWANVDDNFNDSNDVRANDDTDDNSNDDTDDAEVLDDEEDDDDLEEDD